MASPLVGTMKAEERALLAAFPWDDPDSRRVPPGSTYAFMIATMSFVDLDRMLRFEDMEHPPKEWDIVFAWRSFLHGLEILSRPISFCLGRSASSEDNLHG